MTNHTDKELLMLAAKAYGIEVDYRHGSGAFYYDDENTGREEWGPLDDDGQALRLAVKLGLEINICDQFGETNVYASNYYADEKHNSDPYAATRRAIVRAAAAIGEKL